MPTLGSRGSVRQHIGSGRRRSKRPRQKACGRMRATGVVGRTADDTFSHSFSHSFSHWHPLSRSEEHTSELQSLMRISYAVFCLKKKNKLDYNKDRPSTI